MIKIEMVLNSEQRAGYLKWLYAKPQSGPLQEQERLKFLQDFHVPAAFRLLSEVEAWPESSPRPEPGEVVMQRWFRLFFLKKEGLQLGRSPAPLKH